MKSLGGRFLEGKELQSLGFRSIGQNVRVHERASVYGLENISLGDNVRIDDFAVIIASGSLEIGSYVSIPNFCFLGAKFGITLGDHTTLAPGVQIFTGSDDYHGRKLTGPIVPPHLCGGDHGQVTLERHTLIGANTVILPNLTIGEGVSVGSQSLVKSDLEPWGIYAGVPVQRRGERSRELLDLVSELASA